VEEGEEVEKEEQKSSQLRVNNRHTQMFFHQLDVLGESYQLSISTSHSELICKSLKEDSTGGEK
jgi:hypothetical protein